jgi:hypothetical protein
MLKCKIVNLTFKKMLNKDLPCKPNIGDKMPINYINEEVKQIVFVTPLLVSEYASLEGMDLLIYID